MRVIVSAAWDQKLLPCKLGARIWRKKHDLDGDGVDISLGMLPTSMLLATRTPTGLVYPVRCVHSMLR